MIQLAKKLKRVKMFLLMRAYQDVCNNLWVMQGNLYQLV
jgi:hypothetical protein